MINDAKINHFLSLAETLSFTETARIFHLSQQAVSKSIAGLEQDLGVQLFIRTRNFVLLTDAGQSWLDYYLDQRRRFEDQRLLVMKQRAERRNRINMGYQDYLALGGVPTLAMQRLRKIYPHLELNGEQYSPAMVQECLMSQRLDVVLLCRRFMLERKGLKELVLGRIPMLFMVSAMDARAVDGADISEFDDLPYVVNRFEHESLEDCVHRGWGDIKAAGLPCRKVLVVPNRPSVYTTVEMGGGVLLGTAITRGADSAMLRSYPTGVEDDLVCLWRDEGDNSEIEAYARFLQICYQEEMAAASLI